ncbi:MAG TPA: SDR family NAD(P)-dependent oxidoreductase, partial [Chitinophagaceae bacterium]|nr:SDR family NAD(P)-dependent oxidoreductase [Chitinophagaceae bacterium]
MIYTFSLKNKVILVTGGYGYLGKSITESLVFHEAKVYVLGRDQEKFTKAFADSEYLNKTLFFNFCDVSSTESIRTSFKKIAADNNKIDILVNNAFYSEGQSPERMTDKEWEKGIEGTLSSIFKCIREIIPYYKVNNSGKIINVSSMYGIIAPQFEVYEGFSSFLNPPHYGAAKAGIIQLTKYYASYLGQYGILVNTVTPGPFPSDKVQESKEF